MGKDKIIVAIISTLCFVSTSAAQIWIDDRTADNFNCNGTVTDAVCCMDHLCDQLSKSACLTERPHSLLCRWDDSKQECKPQKDDVGNVCCQLDPGHSACHQILIEGKCPDDYEVL